MHNPNHHSAPLSWANDLSTVMIGCIDLPLTGCHML
jgi:hypothetical protein